MRTFFLLLIIAVASCQPFKPVVSQYNFLDQQTQKIDIDDLGNGKVMIYAWSKGLNYNDTGVGMNVYIDNKPLVNINPGEYIIVDLQVKTSHVRIEHLDVVTIKSEHILKIEEDTKLIRIAQKATKHNVDIFTTFVDDMDHYRYARAFGKETKFID